MPLIMNPFCQIEYVSSDRDYRDCRAAILPWQSAVTVELRYVPTVERACVRKSVQNERLSFGSHKAS